LEKPAIAIPRFRSYAPRGALARYVTEVRVNLLGPDAPEHVQLPDGQATVVFRLLDEGSRLNGRRIASGGVYAVGARTTVLRKSVTNQPLSIAVIFRPGGAAPFFRVPMRELTDCIVPLEELWDAEGRVLHERLAALVDDSDPSAHVGPWLTLIEEALWSRMRRPDFVEPDSLRTARLAMEVIVAAPDIPLVGTVAQQIGVSERHLRRIFDDAVGMSPKAFARMVRFQRAARAGQRSRASGWAAVAADAGYFDQAHLIADFRRITGTTPTAFMRTLPSHAA
jgi:AraC-like DNA-binding protein